MAVSGGIWAAGRDRSAVVLPADGVNDGHPAPYAVP